MLTLSFCLKNYYALNTSAHNCEGWLFNNSWGPGFVWLLERFKECQPFRSGKMLFEITNVPKKNDIQIHETKMNTTEILTTVSTKGNVSGCSSIRAPETLSIIPSSIWGRFVKLKKAQLGVISTRVKIISYQVIYNVIWYLVEINLKKKHWQELSTVLPSILVILRSHPQLNLIKD